MSGGGHQGNAARPSRRRGMSMLRGAQLARKNRGGIKLGGGQRRPKRFPNHWTNDRGCLVGATKETRRAHLAGVACPCSVEHSWHEIICAALIRAEDRGDRCVFPIIGQMIVDVWWGPPRKRGAPISQAWHVHTPWSTADTIA